MRIKDVKSREPSALFVVEKMKKSNEVEVVGELRKKEMQVRLGHFSRKKRNGEKTLKKII